MLIKTTLSAIRALLVVAGQKQEVPWSPRTLAEKIDESPTYMAKVLRHLGRAGILKAERGARGGVTLLKSPREIRLLEIVEACQGAIVGDYCRSTLPPPTTCAFHRASLELHEAITGVLSKWTLADLLADPKSGSPTCVMGTVPVSRLRRP